MRGTASAINYLSGSRATLKEDLYEQKRAELSASSSSSTALPEPQRRTVNLPEGVKVYGSVDEESYERRDHLIFAGNRTKILFLGYHQVLERSASETTYNTGTTAEANVRVVSNCVDHAANWGLKLFAFVLSYTVDRIQNILDSLESTRSVILRLSGVIITPKPTGWSGKSAVIYSIRESPNVPGLQTLLVDDSADVLEECNQRLEDFNAIDIKLQRKSCWRSE